MNVQFGEEHVRCSLVRFREIQFGVRIHRNAIGNAPACFKFDYTLGTNAAFITCRTQALGGKQQGCSHKAQTTIREAAMKTTKYGLALTIRRNASEIASNALRARERTVTGWENQRVLQLSLDSRELRRSGLYRSDGHLWYRV